jgi:hypothetical protein
MPLYSLRLPLLACNQPHIFSHSPFPPISFFDFCLRFFHDHYCVMTRMCVYRLCNSFSIARDWCFPGLFTDNLMVQRPRMSLSYVSRLPTVSSYVSLFLYHDWHCTHWLRPSDHTHKSGWMCRTKMLLPPRINIIPTREGSSINTTCPRLRHRSTIILSLGISRMTIMDPTC